MTGPPRLLALLSALGCAHPSRAPLDPRLLYAEGDVLASPDGRFDLLLAHTRTPAGGARAFVISPRSEAVLGPRPLFIERTVCMDWFSAYYLWDQQNGVWVYCADTGFSYYQFVAPDTWRQVPVTREQVEAEAPAPLQQAAGVNPAPRREEW